MEHKATIILVIALCCGIASAYRHDSYMMKGARAVDNDMNDFATEESHGKYKIH